MPKRYTLIKADVDGLKSCAFFLSEKGCRNGNDCKFLHGKQPTQGSASAARSGSVLATKAADVAASTSTTPLSSPISPLDPNEGEKAAKDERAAKKAARKSAKKAGEKGKIAIKLEAHPAPTPVSTPTPRSPKVEPTPLVSKTEAVPASVSPYVITADTVVAVEKRAAREKATREVAAHVARVRATAAAAAAKAAAAEAAAAEAEAAAMLEVEDPKPKRMRKKTPKNPVSEEAVAAVAPAIPEAAPTSTGMAAETVNPKPKHKRNKKMKDAKPSDVPPAAVAMPTSVPNGIPASAPDNTTLTTADGVSLPAATPQREISKRKLCSFFNKKRGCRAGDLCPFLHAGVEGEGSGRTRGGINKTRTSKRSEEIPQQNQPQQPSPVAPKSSSVPSPTPIPSTRAVAGSPSVALPVAAAPVPALSPWSSPVSDEESFQASKKRERPEASAISSQVQPVENNASGGLLEGLPISPFVTSDTEDEDRRDTQSEDWLEKKKAFEMEIPHVRADPWQELVDRTRAHPSYAKNYSFKMDSSWVEAHPCGDGCDALPQVVALDCEMSVSEDAVTKERSGKELVRLSIVRGDDGEKLLDTLVHPSNRVVSWLTNIHGVAPKHLKGVSFMHSHAQEAMMRLCCQRTVIIGHALYNDLSVLKMNHARVVDTSLIFERSDSKFITPSLRDVVKTLFGKDIQSGSHDSVTDSQCTLDAAKFALEARGAPLPVIERTKRKHSESGDRDRKRSKARWMSSGRGERKTKQVVAETTALMVHRLPLGTTEKQLLQLMEKKTNVVAVKAEPIEFNSSTGKSLVVYKSIGQVDLAFNTLSEVATEEASGRLQKKIFLSKDGKKYILVRHPLVMNDEGLPLTSSSGHESSSSSNTD